MRGKKRTSRNNSYEKYNRAHNNENNNSNSYNVCIIYFLPGNAVCLHIKFSQLYEVGTTMISTLRMKSQSQRG